MTLQCDGVKQYIGDSYMFESITINGKTVYIIDGYFYYNIIDIFDTVSI